LKKYFKINNGYRVLTQIQLGHDAAVVDELHPLHGALHLELVEVDVQERILAGDQETAAWVNVMISLKTGNVFGSFETGHCYL
jgi:hypothetical protein